MASPREVVSQLRNDLRYTAQRCREECDELRRQLKSVQGAIDGAGPKVRRQVKQLVRHRSSNAFKYTAENYLKRTYNYRKLQQALSESASILSKG